MRMGDSEGIGIRLDIGTRVDMDWTPDDMKAYAAQAKAAGFTVGAYEDGEGDDYNFMANNPNGVKLIVMSQGIIITKKK